MQCLALFEARTRVFQPESSRARGWHFPLRLFIGFFIVICVFIEQFVTFYDFQSERYIFGGLLREEMRTFRLWLWLCWVLFFRLQVLAAGLVFRGGSWGWGWGEKLLHKS